MTDGIRKCSTLPPLACRPPQGGRSAGRGISPIGDAAGRGPWATRMISPLAGEMAGRPEGGNVGHLPKNPTRGRIRRGDSTKIHIRPVFCSLINNRNLDLVDIDSLALIADVGADSDCTVRTRIFRRQF